MSHISISKAAVALFSVILLILSVYIIILSDSPSITFLVIFTWWAFADFAQPWALLFPPSPLWALPA